MADYVIGDVQGCFTELIDLLQEIEFKPEQDHLYFVGDLVNRGPDSLAVLQWVYANRKSCSTVLGNHDLFLLACWLGFTKPKLGDTISDVLAHSDCNIYLEWLITQPLVRKVNQHIIVHAGVYPGWTANKLFKRAESARRKYAGSERDFWFGSMFGNKPAIWDKELSRVEKFRFTINSLTRMRFCFANGELDFKYKGEIESSPATLLPWFDLPSAISTHRVIFGHWSALGLVAKQNYLSIDTGCIWGGKLTAIRLDDAQIFSVPARQAYQLINAGN